MAGTEFAFPVEVAIDGEEGFRVGDFRDGDHIDGVDHVGSAAVERRSVLTVGAHDVGERGLRDAHGVGEAVGVRKQPAHARTAAGIGRYLEGDVAFGRVAHLNPRGGGGDVDGHVELHVEGALQRLIVAFDRGRSGKTEDEALLVDVDRGGIAGVVP